MSRQVMMMLPQTMGATIHLRRNRKMNPMIKAEAIPIRRTYQVASVSLI